VLDYAGSSAPTGWLLCYGQAVSRSTYSALFTAISTTYGVGDGSTTFNLPDCRGRVSAGKDDMGGSSANRLTDQTDGLDGDTLGDTGGTETQAYTQQGTFTSGTGSSFSQVQNGSFGSFANSSHTHNTTISGTTVAGNNVQPTIIFNKIIFAAA
jgi:microcystin-dependent protein